MECIYMEDGVKEIEERRYDRNRQRMARQRYSVRSGVVCALSMGGRVGRAVKERAYHECECDGRGGIMT